MTTQAELESHVAELRGKLTAARARLPGPATAFPSAFLTIDQVAELLGTTARKAETMLAKAVKMDQDQNDRTCIAKADWDSWLRLRAAGHDGDSFL